MVLCLSVRVCLSATSLCSININERINLVFGMHGGFFRPVLPVLQLRKFK